MPDTDQPDTARPMTDADVPPADTAFTPAAPLKTAGVEFDPAGGGSGGYAALDQAADALGDDAKAATPTADTKGDSGDGETKPADLRQTIVDRAADLRSQAGERTRGFAEEGKGKAVEALGQLTQMLHDAAGQVDERLGGEYGQYARSAAEKVSGLSSAIEAKDIDALLDDARELVRKSPAIAVGTAAAVGFVLARILSAAVDQRDTPRDRA